MYTALFIVSVIMFGYLTAVQQHGDNNERVLVKPEKF